MQEESRDGQASPIQADATAHKGVHGAANDAIPIPTEESGGDKEAAKADLERGNDILADGEGSSSPPFWLHGHPSLATFCVVLVWEHHSKYNLHSCIRELVCMVVCTCVYMNRHT